MYIYIHTYVQHIPMTVNPHVCFSNSQFSSPIFKNRLIRSSRGCQRSDGGFAASGHPQMIVTW